MVPRIAGAGYRMKNRTFKWGISSAVSKKEAAYGKEKKPSLRKQLAKDTETIKAAPKKAAVKIQKMH